LLAPNRFVLDWIVERFLARIKELVNHFSDQDPPLSVVLEIGSKQAPPSKVDGPAFRSASPAPAQFSNANAKVAVSYTDNTTYQSNLNPNFTFDNFVEGKSNQLAKAASL